MDEGDIALAGEEFKAKVLEVFGFLSREFGFAAGADESGIYAHRLIFRHVGRNQVVEVVNAFHGIDYGFEVNIYSASSPRCTGERCMVYFRLKEHQEAGFPFLAEAAVELRHWLTANPSS